MPTENNLPTRDNVLAKNNVQTEKNISKRTAVLIVILVLSLGMNVFLFLRGGSITGGSIFSESFKYVHPINASPIDSNSNSQETALILHYQGLKEILEGEIKNSNVGGKVGIFIQDTKTGSWIGINEKEGFAPASLLKIPIMMAILKKVQHEKINLDDKVTIVQQDLDAKYGKVYERGVGAEFTISELMEEMIAASDNTAKNALKRQLSPTEIDSVFTHVGIPDPYLTNNNQTVSPRGYTRLFKSLYFSTFLSPKLSELALELTTDGLDENLISEGIPTEVQVSHKFGITGSVLHDCGVVYHPKNSYFICVMTKDIEFSKSQELIKSISRDTYNFINEKSL